MRSDQIEALAAHARETFPTGTVWKTPDGYPSSLALCILDSIWSIGVNYDRHVVPVLDRYREIATATGREANLDTPCDLAVTIDRSGGPDAFAHAVNSRHRTSTTNGILKAEAVDQAAQLFCTNNIVTAADLAAREADVKPGWYRIRGQGSGVSWRYLLMLAGIDGIARPNDPWLHHCGDRCRRHESGSGRALDERSTSLAGEPRPTLSEFDHAIWRYQSRRADN